MIVSSSDYRHGPLTALFLVWLRPAHPPAAAYPLSTLRPGLTRSLSSTETVSGFCLPEKPSSSARHATPHLPCSSACLLSKLPSPSQSILPNLTLCLKYSSHSEPPDVQAIHRAAFLSSGCWLMVFSCLKWPILLFPHGDCQSVHKTNLSYVVGDDCQS